MLAADLSELDLVALMIDGVHFAEHLCVVALGIGIDGTKHPLGLVEGDTENTTVVRDLLADLRDRGLDTTRPILCVLDGAKALVGRGAARCSTSPVIQRCQLHKIRNVESKLPDAAGLDRGEEDARRLPQPRRPGRRGDAGGPRPPARQEPSRRGREPARRTGRDAHRHPPRRAAHPGPHAALHERDRVDDRDLPRPLAPT